MRPVIEYLPDREVDALMDEALRALLTTCFIKAQDVVFQWRRYFVDPYPHRWIVRDPVGNLVAHAGVHEKCVVGEGRFVYRVGGVCEVCVHPDYRGRGYVKAMLHAVHEFLRPRDFDFVLLFGRPEVYCSSGYRKVENVLTASDTLAPASPRKRIVAMIHELNETVWPATDVFLPGGKF